MMVDRSAQQKLSEMPESSSRDIRHVLRHEDAPGFQAVLNGVSPRRFLADFWQGHQSNAVPMYLADADGTLIYGNEAYIRIAPALRAAVNAPSIQDIGAAIGLFGQPLRQEVALTVDGTVEHYTYELMVVHDGERHPLAVVARLLPVDALRRAETAMLVAEDRLNDITRLVSDWIWETDAAGKLTYVSQRVFQKLGLHPCELLGFRLTELTEGAGDMLDRLLGPDLQRPFHAVRMEIPHRSGERRAFQLSAVPVYCPDTGVFRGFRGTAHDVTEREAQHAALLKAADDAEMANRAKTEFLANMSHELRTPLNAIMGFSEIIKLEALGPTGVPKYREYASDILESSRHLLNLINDILDIAKIEAGKVDLEETPVEVDTLLRTVRRVMIESGHRAKLRIDLSLARGLPRLLADERRLKQVLLNLLANAIKFTPSGGRIGIEASRAPNGGLTITVRDTGIGMDEADILVAMSPFGQVDSGLGRKFEGTGLGLPLSKALTELHGGTFKLESKPGVGTTVTLQFPASRLTEG